MKMDKVVRKLRPSDYWSIGEHESWFADMASQGLHLKKWGFILLTLKRLNRRK